MYSDGKINYYDNIKNADTYKNCIAGDSNNANKCFTKIFEMINYIYDENNQPIQAKVAFINTNNNKLYIVNQNDKMYSFSGEMNSGKYVATLLYQKKVTKIESTYDTLATGAKNFYTIDLTFDDGTKESYKNPNDFDYNSGAYDLTNK